ncbi:fructose-1,6-bisphosphatase, class II [Candidatus Endolissoclinum faulkneri L5]|uniref:Fructose-1,6-bisphosphatase n=1 Tax=Candidatus Endolissoclinum faulkneri L5 TaxID=1401328 RepID=V9TW08_9PROT|nr:class II fructose-bisphosphatase [Candidatus Endolissoclinum faulkneri]AHC73888.1 fructose-1,6-bisphosphatase, class II [Candidatus Endolissoclinum faulkneri L5]
MFDEGKNFTVNSNLVLAAVEVTEASALAASLLIGKGDEKMADQKAVDAMRAALNNLDIEGTVVIGEGERDEAPRFYTGEKVGKGGAKIDIALDPLEGTTNTAKYSQNALSVIAFSSESGFLNAPDVYMDKIAVGCSIPKGIIDLDNTVEENLKNLANEKSVEISDMVACILDRPRHAQLIARVRETGTRIALISDGDIAAAIATARPNSGIDIYMGLGGAPEGVLAAAAMRCIGGQVQGRLIFRNDVEKSRAYNCGITDINKKYDMMELSGSEVVFAATGVTDGSILRGVRRYVDSATTHSIVMHSKTGIVRMIETTHNLTRKSLTSQVFI